MKKVLVVGSGLAGLAIAHKLTRSGFQVVVYESREWAGGRYRRAREQAPFEVPDLGFFPADSEHLKALESLNRELGLNLLGEVREHRPLTHHHSEWREFIGFGDDPAPSISILSQLNVRKELVITPGFDQMVADLLASANFEIKTRSEVTEFQFEGDRISAAVVNGADRIAVDEVVFCPSPTRLLELIHGDHLKPAVRSRLARSTGFAAITMRIEHTRLESQSPDLRFLLGTGKEHEPAVGRELGQASTWFSLVPSERLHEEEAIGGQIRAIKRVLRRHWPELLDSATSERFFVQEEAYGHLDPKIKIPNLWLANHRMSNLIGSLAEWEAAEKALQGVLALETESLKTADLDEAAPAGPI